MLIQQRHSAQPQGPFRVNPRYAPHLTWLSVGRFLNLLSATDSKQPSRDLIVSEAPFGKGAMTDGSPLSAGASSDVMLNGPNLTLIAQIRIDELPAGSAFFAGIWNGGTSNPNLHALYLTAAGAVGIGSRATGGVLRTAQTPMSSRAVGSWVTVVGTVRGSAGRVVWDSNGGRGANSNSVTATSNDIFVGGTSYNGIYPLVTIGLLAALNIKLDSDDEGAALARDPYGMLLRPRRIWVPTGSASSTPRSTTTGVNAAVRQARTGTASLSSVIRQARTTTASVDAAVRAQRNAAITLGAVLRAARAGTAAVDAALSQSRSSTTVVDAALRAARSTTISLDAATQHAKTATAALEAALLASGTQGTTLSAAVALAQAATVALDMALQAQRAESAILDAVLQQAGSAQVALGAMVQGGSSVYVDLGAAVLHQAMRSIGIAAAIATPSSASTGMSAAVALAADASVALDAAVAMAGSSTVSLGAYVQAGSMRSAAIDAAIRSAQTASASLQAVVALARMASASVDAVVAMRLAALVGANAAVVAQQVRAAALSAYIDDGSGPVFTPRDYSRDLSYVSLINDLVYTDGFSDIVVR